MKKLTLLSVVISIAVALLFAVPAAYASPPNSPLGPIPQLTWTEGTLFPVVHGHVMYPPEAPKKPGSPNGYQTHWYAGSVDNLSAVQYDHSISTTVVVPGSPDDPTDFYYVILSAFDNNGSYDQIGFTAIDGAWGVAYSWTSGNKHHTVYNYSPDINPVNPGDTYQFSITTSDSGWVQFTANDLSSSDAAYSWTNSYDTGGTRLVLAPSYSGYYNYTDYEEVWQTSTRGGAPSYDFLFSPNIVTPLGSVPQPWISWDIMKTSKAPSYVSVSFGTPVSSSVFVQNVP